MELVVVSGKGGTGKTFIASNLLYYLNRRVGIPSVGADADVEAPDLVLALGSGYRIEKCFEVRESRKAKIDSNKCLGLTCLECIRVCMFKAIDVVGDRPVVIEENCEGCTACSIVCKTNAITYYTKLTGKICLYRVDTVPIISGDLEVGERNSGHLVYKVREFAKDVCRELECKHIVIDAAAGIGCPVISSLVGADKAIIVVEPTPQSIEGALRIRKLAKFMNVCTYAIINKHDLNEELSKKISDMLDVEVLGMVPYDYAAVKAYANMQPLIAYDPYSEASKHLLKVLEVIAFSVMGS